MQDFSGDRPGNDRPEWRAFRAWVAAGYDAERRRSPQRAGTPTRLFLLSPPPAKWPPAA